jgi:MFS family permease
LLRHLYPDARARSRAIGVWGATSGFALAAGPVVGGMLVGVWSWRASSGSNWRSGWPRSSRQRSPAGERQPHSGLGRHCRHAAGQRALATLVFAIVNAESAGFGSADVTILLCVNVALAAAFVWWERRASNPA